MGKEQTNPNSICKKIRRIREEIAAHDETIQYREQLKTKLYEKMAAHKRKLLELGYTGMV